MNKQLSTTFTEAEVKALLFVAGRIQLGSDPGQAARSPAWHSLTRKFLKLEAKAKRKDKDQ